MSLGTTSECWAPADAAERQAVIAQLERMLAHPFFSHSKRYPNLLRYVVEHALDGHIDQVKERTLGVEVFGRDPKYDTNLDPVVRTTAGEIRKRIAQYYHLPGHENEIRIDLPSGSYVPEFRMPALASTVATPVVTPAEPPKPFVVSDIRPAEPKGSLLIPMAAAAALVAVLALAVAVRPWARPTALDQFWAPVIDSPNAALLCIGQPHFAVFPTFDAPGTALPESKVSLHDLYRHGKHYVSLSDAATLSRLAGILDTRKKQYRIRGELSTSFADLRDGPVILVGAFNNDWTLRLTGPQRFSFVADKPHYGIKDSQNPAATNWSTNTSANYLDITDDYALISRVKDPTTDRVVVVAAGIAYWGTVAAGEFLADPSYMQELAKSAPKGWEHKNMQIVISTKVIAGNSGPPRVLATHYW